MPPRTIVAKPVANREIIGVISPVAKNADDADLLSDIDRGKSTGIVKIGKGWRLETNSDGRLRWRWQIKDDDGNTVTYVKSDGKTGYARGSSYVGITQRDAAKKTDRRRRKGKHKRG